MKLKEIIKNVDKSDGNTEWVCLTTLGEREFGIFNIEHDEKKRLKAYWYAKWLCTDSWVGSKVYFLDDKVVAISNQPYRKSDEEFKWISKTARLKIKKYLESLTYTDDEDRFASYLTSDDLNEELNIGYTVEYGSNLLTENILHVGTNELVKVTKKYRDFDDVKKWHHIEVEFPNGNKKEVHLNDILIPYLIKQ